MNKIKVGNTWRSISVPAARVNGTWRPCKQIWVKSNGTWVRTFDMTEPDAFDGSGTLEKTPGNVPWQQLSGTWTKGSGVVTASDNSDRVAAVDTGTTDVVINIDADDANKSGEGIAFWIQDQLNWWGLKTFYNYFSFTTPQSPYNHRCDGVGEYEYKVNTTRIAFSQEVGNISTFLISYNYRINRDVRRFCCCTNGTVTVNAFQVNDVCSSTCSSTEFPTCSKSICGTQNRKFCGNVGSCGNGTCPNTPNTSTTTGFTCVAYIANCPTSFSVNTGFNGNLGAICSRNTVYNYSCANTLCHSCTYSPWFTSVTRYYFVVNSSTNKNCPSGPAGFTTVTTYFCFAESAPAPPTTTFVYETRLQLIRSQAGSVNVINSQSYSNMGNVYAATSGNTITARAYSSTGQSGTLYGPWTYDAGSVPKGNKHGILISSVPYQQTYSISRFEADL